MADPWGGSWKPGAWQPGAWGGGGADPIFQLDVVEEGDTLVATGTIHQAPKPAVASYGAGAGGGGYFSISAAKAWLANLITTPGSLEVALAYNPRAILSRVSVKEESDTCGAAASVTGRGRNARDEELLLCRMAA